MRLSRSVLASSMGFLLGVAGAMAEGPHGGGGGGPGGGGGGGGGATPPVSTGGPRVERFEARERAQIRATEEDRLRIHGSAEAAERVRSRAREMRQAAGGSAFGPEQARQHRDRMRVEFQALEQRHAAFAGGLATTERDRIRDRLSDMDQLRDRARDRLRVIDEECAKDVPDRLRLRDQARDMARDMDRLEDAYEDLGVD